MKEDFSHLKHKVIDQGLCARCGTCVGICPVRVIATDSSRYPILIDECIACGLCNACCPGADVDFPALAAEMDGYVGNYDNLLGCVEHTYVSHSTSTEVRHSGASGGIVTALLLYLLKKGRIDGAVIVGVDPGTPYMTKGILATTPEEIKAGALSKYCVTPSMEVLQEVRKRKGKFAVVALPCQIHGLKKLAEADPGLYEKIEVIFGLYCACNMEPNAHLEAMQVAGVDKEEVAAFHYRGGDWPGGLAVRKKDERVIPLHRVETYNTIINVMFRLFGAKRCYLCIDGLAEFADLSFGDFWAFDYSDELSKLERCTLVSQRSNKGLQILMDAERDGAIINHLLPADRISKRTLSMVRGKRSRARIYMAKRRRKKLPNPDYHVPIGEPDFRDRKKNITYDILGRFRNPPMRKLILAVMFSPLIGVLLHRLNRQRMRISGQYHNN
ncbi:MAG: 4Fe-4S dicluster domain-containing protein [Desulfobacterales bacterium]|nr:4Fe-4S dicluster domain-containing protein [Desulfobacterales bacterium]